MTTADIAYLIGSLQWSLLGLVLGYYFVLLLLIYRGTE